MSIVNVDAKVIEQIDQIAIIKKSVSAFMKTIISVTESGIPAGSELPRFWYSIDSVGDEDYENTIKGQDISDMDVSLLNGGSIGNTMRSWFDLHESYYQLVRGYANGLSDFLESKQIRVSSDFADAYTESRGGSLDVRYVFQDNDESYVIGTMSGTTPALVNGGLINPISGDTKIVVGVVSGSTSGPATLTMVMSDKTDETTRPIDVAILGSMNTTDEKVIGQVTPTAITSSDAITHVITVPSIVNFKDNTYVMIENISSNESAYVLSTLVTATSGGAGTISVPFLSMNITLGNLRVTPVFNGVTSMSITANVGNLKIYPIPDRVIAA